MAFTPHGKLSKLKKRELDKVKRETWQHIKPVTRRIEPRRRIMNERKPTTGMKKPTVGDIFIVSFPLHTQVWSE